MCSLGCGPYPILIYSDSSFKKTSVCGATITKVDICFGFQHILVTVQYVPSSSDWIVPSPQIAIKSDIWHSFLCWVSLSFMPFSFPLGLIKCTSSHANTGSAKLQHYDSCLRWMISPWFIVRAQVTNCYLSCRSPAWILFHYPYPFSLDLKQ